MKQTWICKGFGPRYFTATNKDTGEHRVYYSWDALKRDFGEVILEE